jgi:hypothetical protein
MNKTGHLHMKTKKIQEQIPEMPKTFKEWIMWFISYHTGKFLSILLIVIIVIGFFFTYQIAINRNDKTNKLEVESIQMKPLNIKDIKNLKK